MLGENEYWYFDRVQPSKWVNFCVDVLIICCSPWFPKGPHLKSGSNLCFQEWLKKVLDQAPWLLGACEKQMMDVDLRGHIFLLTNWQQSFRKQICICKHNLKLNLFPYYILIISINRECVFRDESFTMWLIFISPFCIRNKK